MDCSSVDGSGGHIYCGNNEVNVVFGIKERNLYQVGISKRRRAIMVDYSKEFIEKCKQIYPKEKDLHGVLESKAWIAQEILGSLFIKYKEDFVKEVINHDLSFEALNFRIKNLRVASELQSESKNFN